jgi:hypothetical protein
MKALLVALLLASFSMQAAAQPAALIEALQMPAWRERDGNRVPLVPEMELRAGDRIVTGTDSRAVVKLAEGSLMKLGANGSLRVEELQSSRELFSASLQVLEGAFRYTTDRAAKARKREVNVRVDQVTIGVRGADFWGRSRAGRQIVCLIEGALEVGAPGASPVILSEPLQFYQRDKGKTQPVRFLEQTQLEQWSREVEIEGGKGTLRRGGRFSVQIAEGDTREAVQAVHEQLRAAGYPAQIAQRRVADKMHYRVRIRHVASRDEAQALAKQLADKFALRELKISP